MTTPQQARALAEKIIAQLDATMGQGPVILDTKDMYAVARAVLELTDDLARLRANQRTAGMVEACGACMGTSDVEWATCGVRLCPIRAAQEVP